MPRAYRTYGVARLGQKEIDMANDTTSLNAKDLPDPPAEFGLNAEAGARQEERRDAAPVAAGPKTPPGRRPLFRN